jgi:GntR family transcriptional regulator
MVDRPSSLYLAIQQEIEKRITSGEFKPGDKLPSEYALAKTYAVSRMTLREALRALEEEGLLSKKHGIGTFVKTTSRRIKSILDVNYSVTEMIRNMGFQPGTKEIKITESLADSHVGKMLNTSEGIKILKIERIRTADEIPVVYSHDIIPTSILSNTNDISSLGESVYDFLEATYNIVLSSSIARLYPKKANRRIAARLGIKINSPLFQLEQVDTDQMGKPVVYSKEYFVSDYFDFFIYRKQRK